MLPNSSPWTLLASSESRCRKRLICPPPSCSPSVRLSTPHVSRQLYVVYLTKRLQHGKRVFERGFMAIGHRYLRNSRHFTPLSFCGNLISGRPFQYPQNLLPCVINSFHSIPSVAPSMFFSRSFQIITVSSSHETSPTTTACLING